MSKRGEVEALVEAIVNWPEPMNVKKLRALLRAGARMRKDYPDPPESCGKGCGCAIPRAWDRAIRDLVGEK